MGLPASGHQNFDKLTATQQEIALRLAKTSGSEILPFPRGLGRSPITIIAAESGIWPKSQILVVAEAREHQSWHDHWLEFGSGANSFYYGVPAPPWGGPLRDDPPGGVCVIKPSDLIGRAGDELIARGWDLALFACPNALNSGTARNKALEQAQLKLRSWVFLDQDDQAIGASYELSELGQYLADLDLGTVYDHVPTISRPGHLLRPSSLADVRRLVTV
jgi:hypothetical protein